MPRTLLEQEALDREEIFFSGDDFSEEIIITTGETSQTAYGIFSRGLTNPEEQGGYKERRFGNPFVTFNANKVTVTLNRDTTILTIRGEDYKIRRIDPPHGDILTVYVK